MFKQPRVPEYRESEGTAKHLKALTLFLKDFCQDAWTASRQADNGLAGIKYPVTSVNGKSGDVKLDAQDVGALASDGKAASAAMAENAEKLDGKTWAEALDALYPVGSIYLSADSASPASLFGGTWEQLKDRFLLGVSDSYEAGSTGGETSHELTADELPRIEGSAYFRAAETTYRGIVGTSGVFSATLQSNAASTVKCEGSGNADRLTMSFGNNLAHNNMPPYLAVYMWKRVA